MHPIEHIRRNVLKVNQSAFGEIAGANQATVSRWENNELEPSRSQLERIRAEVRAREIPWDDAWFFEAPQQMAS